MNTKLLAATNLLVLLGFSTACAADDCFSLSEAANPTLENQVRELQCKVRQLESEKFQLEQRVKLLEHNQSRDEMLLNVLMESSDVQQKTLDTLTREVFSTPKSKAKILQNQKKNTAASDSKSSPNIKPR